MRVGTDDLRVHERRTLALARVVDRLSHRFMAREQIAAVDLLHEEVREAAHELRDGAAGGVHLDGNRDRISVVFDEIHDRKLEIAGGIQTLPELAFARLSLTRRAEDNFIFAKALRDAKELCS